MTNSATATYLIDANVLLYSFQKDAPQHLATYQWLTQRLEDHLILTTAVNEVALLRIATLKRLGPRTAQPEQVFAFLAALHALPNYQHAELGKAGLKRWRALTLALNLTGNDLNDAYLAALAIERGLTLVTADRGFARFAGAGLKLEVLA